MSRVEGENSRHDLNSNTACYFLGRYWISNGGWRVAAHAEHEISPAFRPVQQAVAQLPRPFEFQFVQELLAQISFVS